MVAPPSTRRANEKHGNFRDSRPPRLFLSFFHRGWSILNVQYWGLLSHHPKKYLLEMRYPQELGDVELGHQSQPLFQCKKRVSNHTWSRILRSIFGCSHVGFWTPPPPRQVLTASVERLHLANWQNADLLLVTVTLVAADASCWACCPARCYPPVM